MITPGKAEIYDYILNSILNYSALPIFSEYTDKYISRRLEESESSLDTLERLMEVSEVVAVNDGVVIEDTEATETSRGSDSIKAK